MSRIDDNGTIRDGSTEETNAVNEEIRGGYNGYKLLKEVTISEPITDVQWSSNDEPVDDIFISLENIKGSANGSIAFTIGTTKNQSLTPTISNIVNTSSAKSCNLLWERITEQNYLKINTSADYKDYNIVKYSNNTVYSDKIKTVNIHPVTNGVTVNEGKVKIYGRRRCQG